MNLIHEFKNPAAGNGVADMWLWNGKIDKQSITYKLEDYAKQNISEFFIHPAAGMKVKYMSEEYMELIKYTVSEAERLSLKCWICDENNYPSGTVGGLLLEEYPEYAQEMVCCHKGKCDCFSMRYVFNKKGKFLGAQRIVKKKGRYFADDITDKCMVISENGCNNIQFQAESLVHEDIYFYFSQKLEKTMPSAVGRIDSKGALGYLNMMKKEAVSKFIQMTHNKYKEAIGDKFGKTVLGMFTDRPAPIYQSDGPCAGAWDDKMFEIFENEHGYSLKPYMYALFHEPLSAEDKKARADYRKTIKRLYFENYIKQIADWCHQNNLMFTGCLGDDGNLSSMINQGDSQQAMIFMDIPGFDCGGAKYGRPEIPAKIAVSAAKFKGESRVLCRCGDNETRTYNKLMCLGANMMVTDDNAYRDTLARLQHLSRVTRPCADVLVFCPTRQAEQDDNVLMQRETEYKVQTVFEDTVNALLQRGVGFDIITEDCAEGITVKDGYVEAYGYRYDRVVLPAMHCISNTTEKIIDELLKKNIKTVFMYRVPVEISDTGERTDKYGNCMLVGEQWPETDDVYAVVSAEITGSSIPDIETQGKVYFSERCNQSSQIWFIANDEGESVDISFSIGRDVKLFKADGCKKAYTEENGRVKTTLEPYELVVAM